MVQVGRDLMFNCSGIDIESRAVELVPTFLRFFTKNIPLTLIHILLTLHVMKRTF